MAKPTQSHRSMAIATPLGDDVLLLKSFTGHEELGRPFHYQVELASLNYTINFDQIVGQNVTVRMATRDREPRYFNGFISRFQQGEAVAGLASYQATIVPWLWFLTRTADCRMFQQKSIPEILKDVFRGHGFADFSDSFLTATYAPLEYVVQYRETDFNFVSRLMEQAGIYYFFTHKNGEHHLVLADGPSAHERAPGYGSLLFRSTGGGRGAGAECVNQWSTSRQVQAGAYALKDYDFKRPAASLLARKGEPLGCSHGDFEVFDYPGEYVEQGVGDHLSAVRLQELHAQYEVATAQTDARGIGAGWLLELKDHPRQDQCREYLLTRADWQAHADEFVSGGGGGGGGEAFTGHFTAIPSQTTFRTARVTPKPVVQGPQTAAVVGPAGEEIYTDAHGRVKVQFYWDRHGVADDKSSCWIRVAQLTAGKGWGSMHLPRIGQEVIVEFLEGDPDRPIITGRVYNGTNTPPYKLPDEKTKSTTKSNSSKGGNGFNEIRFEDKKGDEQVFIHAEKNQDINVKHDCFETIGHDRHLLVKRHQVEEVDGNRHERVKGSHHEAITGHRHLAVVGNQATAITGSMSLAVTGDVAEAFKGNHAEEVKGDIFVKGANIVIEAGSNVTIKVGQSFIAIEASGITISTPGKLELKSTGQTEMTATAGLAAKGATVDIKADATMNLKAGAMAELASPMTTVKGDGMTIIKGGIVMIN